MKPSKIYLLAAERLERAQQTEWPVKLETYYAGFERMDGKQVPYVIDVNKDSMGACDFIERSAIQPLKRKRDGTYDWGAHHSGEDLVRSYTDLFSPRPVNNVRYAGYWGNEWYDDSCRVLALCFMAAIVDEK